MDRDEVPPVNMEMDVDPGENDDEPAPMKFTDVIDDCLEIIFGHLDVKDLFSVALANKNFTKVAALVAKRKYGERHYKINPFAIWNVSQSFAHEMYYLNNPLNPFTFIRIFGSSIPIQRMFVPASTGRIRKTKEYIDQYCIATDIPTEVTVFWRNIEVPHCPELTRKTLIPHLQGRLKPEETHFAVKFTRLNDDLVDTLITGLPQRIESLSIDYDTYGFRSFSCTSYVFQHLTKFSLCRGGDRPLTSAMTRAMKTPPPIAFSRLEEMKLCCPFDLSGDWLKFITQNKNLNKLELIWPTRPERPFENEHWQTLIAAMPQLENLVVDRELIDYNFFLDFIAMNSSVDLRLYRYSIQRTSPVIFRKVIIKKRPEFQ